MTAKRGCQKPREWFGCSCMLLNHLHWAILVIFLVPAIGFTTRQHMEAQITSVLRLFLEQDACKTNEGQADRQDMFLCEGNALQEIRQDGRPYRTAKQVPAAGGSHVFLAKTADVFRVTIDINPGIYPNRITPGSTDVISVAILTDDHLDATTIDPVSVRFGATGTEAAPLDYSKGDVNGDGRLDVIAQFETEDTGIVCGLTSAVLTGKTRRGRDIKGTDLIETKGC